MTRQNKWTNLLIIAILMASLTPMAGMGSAQAQVPAAPLRQRDTEALAGDELAAQTENPPEPLPRGCDDVNPLDPPACCMYGYAYYNGVPMAGASVHVESPYGALDTTTASGGASSEPYYRVDLSSAPLSATTGTVITLTASYSSTMASRTWTVVGGGQQVDMGVHSQTTTWFDGFDGTDLNSDLWTFGKNSPAGGYAVADGVLTLSGGTTDGGGAWVVSNELFTPGAVTTTLEVRAAVSVADRGDWGFWEDGGDRAALFLLDSGTLYAQVYITPTNVMQIAIPGVDATAWHVYQLEIGGSTAHFYVDGLLKATHTENVPQGVAMHIRLDRPSMGQNYTLSVDYAKLWRSGGSTSPWPMYLHDSQHTGRSPFVGPSQPYLKWHYSTLETNSSPAIGPDGTIYAGQSDYHLYALHPNGTLAWSYATPNVVWSSPGVAADGTVYFGHNGYSDGNFVALNPDGSFKWSYPIREARSSPTIAADGTIYVGGGSSARLYALNPDGSLKWQYRSGFAEAYASPAIGADGTIYITGTKERNLHAVNPDGTAKWTFPLGSLHDAMSSPVIGGDGTIYVGGADNQFYAVNPDGTLKWSYTVGEVSCRSASIGPDGTVYIITLEGDLYAFNPAGGDPLWIYSTPDVQSGVAPTVDGNGTIYFAAMDARVYAINPDGSEKWVFQTPSTAVYSSIAINSDGTLYVAGGGGVYAIGDSGGDIVPSAAFNASLLSGSAPLAVQFTDQSTGDITTWDWAFGDGSTSGARHPYYIYEDAGLYTVSLTVTGPGGSDTETKADYILVNSGDPSPPLASIAFIWYSSYPNPAVQGQDTVYFNGSGYDSDEGGAYITAYEWTSSLDGLLSAQEDFTVPASELSAGTHTIGFKVQDDEGIWSQEASRTLTVQGAQSDVHTLILIHRQKLASLYSTSEANQVLAKLNTLAAHESVKGLVIQVENDPAIAAAYAAWNADPTNTAKANAVTASIKGMVDAQWAAYPGLEYLVIVGDDRVLPFHRVLDQTRYPESNYDPVSCDSVTGAALCGDMTLTDDYYADAEPTVPGSPTWDGHELYIPDLGIGRLIETPAEIMAQIDAFLAGDEVASNDAVVTGYDFVQDGAQAMCDALDGDGLTADCTLIGGSWNPDQFKNKVFNTHHDVVAINGHASHYLIGTPSGDVSSADVAGATADLTRAVFYTVGCHSGLNVPPGNPGNDLDTAQALAGRKANYVANTGYGWGYLTSIGLSEQLMLNFTERLVYGQSATIGQALAAAKQKYYLDESDFDSYDEKTLIESTLYGLPMYRYATSTTSAEQLKAREEGVTAVKQEHMATLGGGFTVNSVSYQFPALLAETTGDGQYYTFGGQVHAGDGEPIQPKYVGDLSFPQTKAHGVVFKGGAYLDQTAFNPVVDRAITETTTVSEPLFDTPNWYPAQFYGLNRLERGDNLVTLLGQFNSEGQVERLYDQLSFDFYYHTTSNDWTGPSISCVRSDPGAGTTTISVNAGDASGIQAVVVAYTAGGGRWDSTSLTQSGSNWSGTLVGSGSPQFFVQVVDKAGNVSVDDNDHRYFWPGQGRGCKASVFLPLVLRNH